jgi:hypothetical protein
VSAVETPPPPTPPPPEPAQRRCPRCGSALTGEQEWCLECGASVGTTIAAPPSWRGPVALVVVLFTIAVLALVLALVELAGDAEQVGPGTPAAQTPAPTATPGVAATTTPDSVTIPPATDDGSASGTPEIADWPEGKDAWTIVLESASTNEAATTRATELAGQGVPVGILNSDEYASLEPGRFVVFSGQYDSQRAANQGLQDLSGQVEGAYVRHVAPQASAGDSATATPSATSEPRP